MIIDLRIGRTNYKINCQESEKEKILELADRLDSRIQNLQRELHNVDDRNLLLIASLMLEEELENKKSGIFFDDSESDQVHEALSESINNIAEYIDNLTDKIQKY